MEKDEEKNVVRFAGKDGTREGERYGDLCTTRLIYSPARGGGNISMGAALVKYSKFCCAGAIFVGVPATRSPGESVEDELMHVMCGVRGPNSRPK